MSGDVQPRKRKDKKKIKRDSLDSKSEGDVFTRKASLKDEEDVKEHHHGVHATKMGKDDVHLHVQSDHATGGHWCAKIFFFSLLAILFGLVGIIILENRGSSDLDTPLSESRFSEYFEGWVDEHRASHDDHGPKTGIDDHDSAPFEEEEDHSEQDDEEAHDISQGDSHDEEDDDHGEEEEELAKSNEDEGVDNSQANDDEDDEEEEEREEVDDENEDNEEDDDEAPDSRNVEEETAYSRSKRDIKMEDEDDNDDVDEGFEDDVNNSNDNDDDNDQTNEEDDDNNQNSPNEEVDTIEQNDDDDDNPEDDQDAPFEESSTNKPNVAENAKKETISPVEEEKVVIKNVEDQTDQNEKEKGKESKPEIIEQPSTGKQSASSKVAAGKGKEDDDFDDDEASLEKVVDNDAGEELHLRQKAEQEELAAKAAAVQEEEESESAPKVRGPQSFMDDDSFLDEEIRRANEELFNDNLKPALQIFDSLILKFPGHPGALYGKAKVLDRLSTKYKNNQMLQDAIEAYRVVLKLEDKADDKIYREAGERCVQLLRFGGMLAQAVPIHRNLIRRFPNDPEVRNQLAVTYLMQNRYAEAKYILHHTLMRWRDNGFAQVHYGFILKVHDNDLKSAVALLREGIASEANGTQDGRFYFTLGDALYRLGEKEEAMEVYKKGADLKLFPSALQRSLYNVNGLKAQPFWTPEETTYEKELSILQRNWELIQKEGLTAMKIPGYYEDEAESLRDKGNWKQLELFARGYRIEKNCAKTPLTCNIIETFPAARTCKRGQVKFSIMQPGTHVWPHCGPTNCRLRAHLGLVVPPGAKIRVGTEERTWKAGEWLIFDDSFEHEVWHNGISPRLVLIVDVWHPELTEDQRENLSRI